MPIDALMPVVRRISATSAAHRRLRRDEPGQVEVGLVEAELLDELDVRAQDLHHRARGGAVGLEVGRDDDRVAGTAARACDAGIAEPMPKRRAS